MEQMEGNYKDNNNNNLRLKILVLDFSWKNWL